MVPTLTSDEEFGNMGFHMYWQPVTEAFTMAPEPHKHDFPRYLIFSGSDPRDYTDLCGEIDLTLSEDGQTMEKHVITKASSKGQMRGRVITKANCGGITSKQVVFQAGQRLAKSGVKIGNLIQLPPGANLENYRHLMRGAGFAIRKEDLRKMQRHI